MSNGADRIYMNEVIKKIDRRDIRSGITWCKNNNVTVHNDTNGKFVYSGQFRYAYELPLINDLVKRYKEDWKRMYELTVNNDLYTTIPSIPVSSNGRYKPKSKDSEDFLKRFKN